MSTKLQLKGTTQITITPVMHYFIQLLANNRLEFLETILNEVEANPMLEVEPEEETSQETEKNEYEDRLNRADSSFITPYEDHGFFQRDPDAPDKNKALENLTPSRETLSEHLMKQAQASFAGENEMEIARQIVYNLDSDGYLKLEIESIASMLNTLPEEIERTRSTIKTFDPPGCASRTLQECLIAQVGEHPEDGKLKILIERHLENLSRSRYDEITRDLEIEAEQLFLLVARLKRLTPKPAKAYDKDETEYAEVDLMLIKENSEYKLIYIEEGVPRILLSRYYQEMLQKTTDKKTDLFSQGTDIVTPSSSSKASNCAREPSSNRSTSDQGTEGLPRFRRKVEKAADHEGRGQCRQLQRVDHFPGGEQQVYGQ